MSAVTHVFLDFDGVMTCRDVGHAIMERFAPARWREYEKQWQRGELSTEDNMRAQIALIAVGERELADFVAGLPMREGLGEFVARAREVGVDVTVVSDGFDFYIRPLLDRHGLSDLTVLSNRWSYERGRPVLAFPHACDSCGKHGVCKERIVADAIGRGARVAYAGDGWSDVCAAKLAHVLFARDALALRLADEGIAFTPFESFHTLNRELF